MDSTGDILALVDDAFAEALEETGTRATISVTCQIEKPLMPEDIAEYLSQTGDLDTTQKAEAKDVRVLRSRHHSVARLLAEGVPESVVATITGYTEGYMNVLKQNPSMLELIEHYRAPGNLAIKEVGENLKRVALSAVEVIEQKIEGGDDLTIAELVSVAKLGLDRSGHGPQSTHNIHQETHIIDHAELQARHLEARRRDRDLIVDPEIIRPNLLAPPKEASDELGQQ